MKKTTLCVFLLSATPVFLLAQFGGGNGNGEVLKPITTLQLDGAAVSIYIGGNGRGERLTTQNTNQLNGDTVDIFGGGNGRGETVFTLNNNEAGGTTSSIFGGGNGRGEIIAAINTNQLNGSIVQLYSGGDGRGETLKSLNTNPVSGEAVTIYGGGNGRGEINFIQNTLQLDGLSASIYLGGDGRGETAITTTNIPLPIQLMSFDAILDGKQVKVQWQTATEINTAFFVVDKSLDGINWKQIGQVKAAGNSTSILNYELIDANVAEGINYYRLKPTDVNGRFTYSSIATVNYHHAVLAATIAVYPNPVKYQFTLQINGADVVSKLGVKLVNVSGRTVLQKQNLSGNTHVFDMGTLINGTYFLIVNNNGIVSAVKIIKE